MSASEQTRRLVKQRRLHGFANAKGYRLMKAEMKPRRMDVRWEKRSAGGRSDKALTPQFGPRSGILGDARHGIAADLT